MRQVFVTRAGPPDVLRVRESADPDAGPGEVRIRVRAAGVNFADLAMRMGMYPAAPPIPFVIGYEVSGVVDQVGEGVDATQIGQRVLAMPRFGGYTDTLVVPAQQVLQIGEAITFEAAAALPVAYLTAHHAMFHTGAVHPGAHILVHSVAGGVGLAAMQLARTRDCVILGTCSTGKFDFAREHGCHHPIDSSSDLRAEVSRILGDRKLDLILDPIGGPSARQSYEMLGPGGRLVCFGFSAAQGSGTRRSLFRIVRALIGMPKWTPFALMNDNKTVTGVNMERMFDHQHIVRPQMEKLVQMCVVGQIAPFVDRTFSFDDAPAAHQYLHDRKSRGKLLLVP